MDNTSSSPQIVVPMIPPGVCFQGTTTEILNQFGQQIIGQAVIDVPGLGDVTPSQIIALQEEDQRLQNEIDALGIDKRFGTLPITVGDNNIPIAFTSDMPDTNYLMSLEFVSAAGTAASAPGWAILQGTKTVSGVTVRIMDAVADIIEFNYVAERYLT